MTERDEATEAFVDKLLRLSHFVDPRVVPLSEHWRTLQARNPRLFDEFLAGLIKDELRLFFHHAMSAKEREVFWLKYVPSIRRTVAVLAKGTRATLEEALHGTSEGRSVHERTLVARHGKVSAFCLHFDRLVVVEFSEVGNAAFFYARDVFDTEVFPSDGKFERANQLKADRVRHVRITHTAGWQSKVADLLRSYGVEPTIPNG